MTDLCFKLIRIQYTVNPDLRQSLWILPGCFSGLTELSGRAVKRKEAEENQRGAMEQTTPGRIQVQRSAGGFFCFREYGIILRNGQGMAKTERK